VSCLDIPFGSSFKGYSLRKMCQNFVQSGRLCECSTEQIDWQRKNAGANKEANEINALQNASFSFL